MCEKFNSGYGGYICDNCRTLLWAGRDGLQNPENRQYIYSTTAETVFTFTNPPYLAFCSQKCANNYTPFKEYE